MFQVSRFSWNSQCKYIISSQGTYTGNTKSLKSPQNHKHLLVCSLIPTLSLCLSQRSNSITLNLNAITIIPSRILARAWRPSHVNTWLSPLIEPFFYETTMLGEWAGGLSKELLIVLFIHWYRILQERAESKANHSQYRKHVFGDNANYEKMERGSHNINDYLPACIIIKIHQINLPLLVHNHVIIHG